MISSCTIWTEGNLDIVLDIVHLMRTPLSSGIYILIHVHVLIVVVVVIVVLVVDGVDDGH